MPLITPLELHSHLNLATFEGSETLLEQKIAAAESYIEAQIDGTLADFGATPPAAIVEAVYRVAAELYENREASIVGETARELPLGVAELLAPYRKWSF